MKLHALALVLAVFTGSLASVRGDEQRPLFTQLLEDVRGYLDVVASAAGQKADWLSSLNSSQELRKQIVNDYSKLGAYLEKLLAKSPAEVQETAVQFGNIVGKLLVDNVVELGARTEGVYLTLRDNLVPFAEPILGKMRGQAEALSTRIQKFSRKEKERLKLQLDELKTHEADLDSFIHEVHGQWLKLQKSMEPWVDWFDDYFPRGMETLKPYLASVLQAPEGHTKE